MSAAVHFDIDLTLENDGESFATVTANGAEIEVFLTDPARVMRGGRGLLSSLRTMADGLAARGIVLTVSGPGGMLASIGAVKGKLMDAQLTGSKNVRLGSLSTLLSGRRSSAGAESAVRLPPPTLFPLVPTIERRRRTRVTTTHYTPGAGRPRLIFVVGSEFWDGTPPREFELLPTTTVIGSSPHADLQLDGLEPMHAEIRHTDDDEYVLVMLASSPVQHAVLDGAEPPTAAGRVLRTGARIEVGDWRMGYFREEFADHGRPFGGRLGGELSRQTPQPPRKKSR